MGLFQQPALLLERAKARGNAAHTGSTQRDFYGSVSFTPGGDTSEERDFALGDFDVDAASLELRVSRQGRLDPGGQLPILPPLLGLQERQ